MSEPSGRSIVAALPLFAGIELDVLSAIASRSRLGVARPGELVFAQDDPCDRLYFLVEGRVTCYRAAPDGREQVVKLCQRRGEAFPPLGAFTTGRHVVSARALTAARLCSVDVTTVVELARRSTALAFRLLQAVGKEEVELIALVADLGLRNATARLARVLYGFAMAEGTRLGSGVELDRRRVREDELATLIGTVRVHVSRCLHAIARTGAIRLTRRSIVIPNLDALRRAADGDEAGEAFVPEARADAGRPLTA